MLMFKDETFMQHFHFIRIEGLFQTDLATLFIYRSLVYVQSLVYLH